MKTFQCIILGTIYITTLALVGCDDIRDISFNQGQEQSSIFILKNDGLNFLGHGGLVYRNLVMYNIYFKSNLDKLDFSEMTLKRDDKDVKLVRGYIELIDSEQVKIYLFENKDGRQIPLDINGTHYIK